MKQRVISQKGFTIVELLIVIVVIAILAAITVVAYNGIQARARSAKEQTDLKEIQKAIVAARISDGQILRDITGVSSGAVSSDACQGQSTGTKIEDFSATSTCYLNYKNALDKISNASGMNIRNIYDPWGRPYIIYEAEGRTSSTPCNKDFVAALRMPHTQWTADFFTPIDNFLLEC